MRTSQIVIPQPKVAPEGKSSKLVSAYKKERTQQEITEVELNRGKIVMIDENGEFKSIPILAEH
ncbi:hypothetical protein VIOR3934_08741 [Vibrio orientalis CIP 102891 = ATCC 33934]|uniref:Uncharacterized protein n=1 Tax=Vibrio orientalis CIP 102891 = ATCC 33934 TaxID=675816 RepID=C9QDT8_VIBOR|nr:hypothetical protein [Vibrio orientalis]EEX93989.1 hypothetical protein VIA_001147 [Vibrio orientalis CIP 102891 = ATCC 33934]EGU52869.1 hypothetical protein VIOR3934_08741 [Vibrio orientalis CIP 102891 = ATCC 33934]